MPENGKTSFIQSLNRSVSCSVFHKTRTKLQYIIHYNTFRWLLYCNPLMFSIDTTFSTTYSNTCSETIWGGVLRRDKIDTKKKKKKKWHKSSLKLAALPFPSPSVPSAEACIVDELQRGTHQQDLFSSSSS